jgi:hypothetical protein
MRRGITLSWHGLSFLIAAILFFIFVLPRWWELMGDVSPGLGTAMRIVTGLLVGLSALPVVLNLVKTRKPEFGTPALALTLRVWSIVGHVLAAVLIVGTAIAEIWVTLDDAGQWLFGVYGAAAAIAVLGAGAFQLSFVAEMPPPPPKPLKPKKVKTQAEPARDPKPAQDVEEVVEEEVIEEESLAEPAGDEADEVSDESAPDEQVADEPVQDEPSQDTEDAPEGGRLRNRRPHGKNRRSGGVAVTED